MSKKWRIYGVIDATTYVGVVEAETKEEAEKKGWEKIDNPSICHHCSESIDVGDVYELIVEEDK